jgi:hypothetical protein
MLVRALVWGPAAVLLAALPAAVRLWRAGISFPDALMGNAALLCVPIMCAFVLGGVVHEAIGELPAGTPRRTAVGVSIWAAICFPVDAALGSVLQVSTHHRPLAGVTFAAMAFGVAIGAALVSLRTEPVLTRLFDRGGLRRIAVVAVGLAASAVLIALTAKGWHSLSTSARSCVIDGAVGLVFAGAGLRLPLRKGLWVAGLVAMVAIVAAGGQRLGSSGELAAAIGARAPLAWAMGAAVEIMH